MGTVQSLPGAGVLYCSTFKFDFADKISVGNEKCLTISKRLDR
jgi:hypothetical protein